MVIYFLFFLIKLTPKLRGLQKKLIFSHLLLPLLKLSHTFFENDQNEFYTGEKMRRYMARVEFLAVVPDLIELFNKGYGYTWGRFRKRKKSYAKPTVMAVAA